jgi:hypothetical protein
MKSPVTAISVAVGFSQSSGGWWSSRSTRDGALALSRVSMAIVVVLINDTAHERGVAEVWDETEWDP